MQQHISQNRELNTNFNYSNSKRLTQNLQTSLMMSEVAFQSKSKEINHFNFNTSINNHSPKKDGILINVTNQNTPNLSPHSYKSKGNTQNEQYNNQTLKQSPLKLNQKQVANMILDTSTSSASFVNQTPTSSNLILENSALKTQIEMLKQALIGICKDQDMNIQLLPFLKKYMFQNIKNNSQQNENNENQNKHYEQELAQFINALEQQAKQSPMKANSPNQFIKLSETNENSKEFIYLQHSTQKKNRQNKQNQLGSTRRKKADRSNNQNYPSSNEQTPIQFKSVLKQNIDIAQSMVTPLSKIYVKGITEIYLGSDSKDSLKILGNELNNQQLENEKLHQGDIKDQETNAINISEIINNNNESSINNKNQQLVFMNSQQEEGLQANNNQDSSQLQIKYAKMLEELENQSANSSKLFQDKNQKDSNIKNLILDSDSKAHHKNALSSDCYLQNMENQLKLLVCQENMFTPQKDDTQLKIQIQKIMPEPVVQRKIMEHTQKKSFSSSCSRTFHQKNKKSSQYEYKQHYEQELNQLKNELEEYAKEEEKLLSIIESSHIQNLPLQQQKPSPISQRMFIASSKHSPQKTSRRHMNEHIINENQSTNQQQQIINQKDQENLQNQNNAAHDELLDMIELNKQKFNDQIVASLQQISKLKLSVNKNSYINSPQNLEKTQRSFIDHPITEKMSQQKQNQELKQSPSQKLIQAFNNVIIQQPPAQKTQKLQKYEHLSSEKMEIPLCENNKLEQTQKQFQNLEQCTLHIQESLQGIQNDFQDDIQCIKPIKIESPINVLSKQFNSIRSSINYQNDLQKTITKTPKICKKASQSKHLLKSSSSIKNITPSRKQMSSSQSQQHLYQNNTTSADKHLKKLKQNELQRQQKIIEHKNQNTQHCFLPSKEFSPMLNKRNNEQLMNNNDNILKQQIEQSSLMCTNIIIDNIAVQNDDIIETIQQINDQPQKSLSNCKSKLSNIQQNNCNNESQQAKLLSNKKVSQKDKQTYRFSVDQVFQSMSKSSNISPMKQILRQQPESKIRQSQELKEIQKGLQIQQVQINPSQSQANLQNNQNQKDSQSLINIEENKQYLTQNQNRQSQLSDVCGNFRETQIKNLEQLSKIQSLAKGLIRQEEEEIQQFSNVQSNINSPQKKVILNAIYEIQSKNQSSKKKRSKYQRRKVQELNESQCEQDLINSGNYFGKYSKEKSEELKKQRCESIKKAEELLSSFIINKQNRPQFLQKESDSQIELPNQFDNNCAKYYISDMCEEQEIKKQVKCQESQRYKIIDEGEMRENSNHLFDKDSDISQQEKLDQEIENEIQNNQNDCNQNINLINKPHFPGFIQTNEISFHNQELCQVSFVRNSYKSSIQHSRSSSVNFQNKKYNNIINDFPLNIQLTQNIDQESFQIKPQIDDQIRNNNEQSIMQSNKCSGIANLSNKQINGKCLQIKNDIEYSDQSSASVTVTALQAHQFKQEQQDKLIQQQQNDSQHQNKIKKIIQQDFPCQPQIQNRRKSHHEQCKIKQDEQSNINNSKIEAYSTTNQRKCSGENLSQQKKKKGDRKCLVNKILKQVTQNEVQPLYSFNNAILHQDNQYDNQAQSTIQHNQLTKSTNDQDQTQQIQNNTQQQNYAMQYNFNNTYLDAELLYEKRSKSVVKRREELIRKKEQQNRLKIEAKYQKIDNLRQTRNERIYRQGGARSLNQCNNAKQIAQVLQANNLLSTNKDYQIKPVIQDETELIYSDISQNPSKSAKNLNKQRYNDIYNQKMNANQLMSLDTFDHTSNNKTTNFNENDLILSQPFDCNIAIRTLDSEYNPSIGNTQKYNKNSQLVKEPYILRTPTPISSSINAQQVYQQNQIFQSDDNRPRGIKINQQQNHYLNQENHQKMLSTNQKTNINQNFTNPISESSSYRIGNQNSIYKKQNSQGKHSQIKDSSYIQQSVTPKQSNKQINSKTPIQYQEVKPQKNFQKTLREQQQLKGVNKTGKYQNIDEKGILINNITNNHNSKQMLCSQNALQNQINYNQNNLLNVNSSSTIEKKKVQTKISLNKSNNSLRHPIKNSNQSGYQPYSQQHQQIYGVGLNATVVLHQQQNVQQKNIKKQEFKQVIPKQQNQINSNYKKQDQQICHQALSQYIKDPQINQLNQDQQCNNCERLLNKGLSTEFCLQHFHSPQHCENPISLE